MISHTLAKIYGSVLEREISTFADRHGFRAQGQAGFRRQHSTLDHIFTLRAIIEEARSRSEKVYCCFVDFRKAFDTVPRARLIQRLSEMGFPDDMIWAVVALYESVRCRVRAPGGLSDFFYSTVGVKQGCPLSPTLFGIYIDEIMDFIDRLGGEGSWLTGVMVAILLYADDIVLISSSAEGLQRHLDALDAFCSKSGLTVNLGKTKVMIFHTSRPAMHRHSFSYRGEQVEIVSSYTYLGVVFSGPLFRMIPASRARLTRGQGALARLERQCFQAHFQDPPTKGWLFDTLVRPAAMYGAPFWACDLPETGWRQIERLQILLCSRMIRSKPSIPHQIIQAEFGVSPLQVDALFQTVTYLQRVWQMPRRRLPRLALESSRTLAQRGMAGCWYARISSWFDRHGFSVDRLPPFRYSLDSPFVRLTRQEINRIIRLDLARISTQATWQGTHELPTRLLFYREQFMHWSEDGELIRPRYLESHMSHALRIAIGQLRVSSHQLRIESGRAEGIPREHRICRLCTTGEVETEEHYICRCPLYYEIRGRYHCLFAEGFGPLARVMNFPDQRCLGLFLIELRRLRDHTLRRVQIVRGHPPSPERDRSQRHITDYTSRDGETEGEHDHPCMTGVDHDDRGRRRPRQMEDSPQRQVRPRTMVVHPITDTLGDTSHVHGVTIDMAQRILQRRRPLVPRRHCTQRQLLIRDMLIRHRQSTPPSTSDVISTFSFLTEAGEDEETQPPIPTTP